MTVCDYLVIGGGIAGASAAAELAASDRVILVERESQPGYHATGRSAATFAEAYGPAPIRALTAASRAFLTDPPTGFATHPLMTRRGVLFIGRRDQSECLEILLSENQRVATLARLSIDEALALVPALNAGYVAVAAQDSGSADMDVHGLHDGYLRMLRARGGRVETDAEVRDIRWTGDHWRVETKAGIVETSVLVNAAGAWADDVAALAGVATLDLVPKRRTVVTFDPPVGMPVEAWPLVVDAEEQFYFKPEGGRLLASPADETPSPPCDAQPEEIDIAVAVAVDRVTRATTLAVDRIVHSWAGLRTFAADGVPAVGWDGAAEAFFWLAGQGGYGIQTAPAMARAAAALARDRDMPWDVLDFGVTKEDLAPARLRRNDDANTAPPETATEDLRSRSA